MDNRWIFPHSPVLSRPFQTHEHRVLQHINHFHLQAFAGIWGNQSIIVFCPWACLSMQTQNSPLFPLLSLPFRIFIQSIYHNVLSSDIFFYLEFSFATAHLPRLAVIASRSLGFRLRGLPFCLVVPVVDPLK